MAAVADSLEFEHKYTSGVIAWAPEDQPSDRDIDRVDLHDFWHARHLSRLPAS